MRLIQKILFLITGIFIISCSINLIVVSTLGATPWDSANFTLANYYNITPGLATFITGLLLTLSIELINYKKFKLQKIVNITVVICLGFLLGYFINFTSYFITLLIPPLKIFGVIGIFTFGLGINFVSVSKLPADPIDNFMLKLIEYYKISITKARIITDIVAIVIALIFGIMLWKFNIFSYYLGIGTILSFFLLPVSINLFRNTIFKKYT